MDPLSITAATIAIIGSISSTYNTIQHLRGLPKAFKEVGQNLPLVKETLDLARGQLQTTSDESVKKAIEPVITACQERAIALKDIFDKLDKAMEQQKDANEWSALVNLYRKTVVYLGKSHKVETLMQELLDNLRCLAIHQLFKVNNQGLATKLENAINELSAVEPSLPDSDFETKEVNVTQTNSDNARGFVSTGGHQENTMGHKFHSAGNMSFGMDFMNILNKG
jgi:hypothetical protein